MTLMALNDPGFRAGEKAWLRAVHFSTTGSAQIAHELWL